MKTVTIIAPEFPPSNTAGSHRSRLFSSHLSKFGWKPTVLSVDEKQIEGPLDRDLEKLLPPDLEVVRTSALPIHPIRVVGDMGLRSLWHHKRALEEICRRGKPDILFIPGPPWFMFLLGPFFLKKYGLPYVIDYIDPWKTRRSGQNFFSKAGIYDALAHHYETKVLKSVAFVTAVSQGIGEDLLKKYPFMKKERFLALPYGANPADFDTLSRLDVHPPDFSSGDGCRHICFTGAFQPSSSEIVKVFLTVLKNLNGSRAEKPIKAHFYGTSNLTWGHDRYQVLPMARELGSDSWVTEKPERIAYLQALCVQKTADINLVMGSTDHYYHASKLYPCLLAKKPILAICHEDSSIRQVFETLNLEGCVTFSDPSQISKKSELIQNQIQHFLSAAAIRPADLTSIRPYLADAVTEKLAGVFNAVTQTA